ncbi:MAG: response regulator [Acidobacteriota bacterium]
MLRRILIVDDEPAILMAVRTYLTTRQYEADVAEDLETAESLLVANDYHAVITDLRLSRREGSEGLEIIRFVRENLPAAKTVLLTAYGSPKVEAEAKALGVDLYVQKPIALSELERLLRVLLDPVEVVSD